MDERFFKSQISYLMSWNKNKTVFFLWFSSFLKWKSVKPEYCICVCLSWKLFCFLQTEKHFMWKRCFHVLFLIIKRWRHGKFCIQWCSFFLTRRCHYSLFKLASAFCMDKLVLAFYQSVSTQPPTSLLSCLKEIWWK